MGRLRLSFSLIDNWSKGRIDEAVALYLHLPTKTSPQMEDGKKYHEKWEKEIKSKKSVKIGKSVYKFKNPKSEHQVITPYNDRWDIKAIFDCLDDKTLYEFKTGATESLRYSRSYQVPFYFLVAKLAGIEIDKAVLIQYNQYSDQAEVLVIWNNPNLIESAKNFIDSIAPEIEHYFIEKNIPLDKN